MEHSYALPDNRIQVENASESAVTENVVNQLLQRIEMWLWDREVEKEEWQF